MPVVVVLVRSLAVYLLLFRLNGMLCFDKRPKPDSDSDDTDEDNNNKYLVENTDPDDRVLATEENMIVLNFQ